MLAAALFLLKDEKSTSLFALYVIYYNRKSCAIFFHENRGEGKRIVYT